ncbi:MAG: exodeoxyribonuclease VII small subunit [Butyrivibrio sp.]|jgi:exodeoxyribonuclease VII small subunit|nr:exodeoxyribonuclease VII small subunit [Butyrivibrio sp.]
MAAKKKEENMTIEEAFAAIDEKIKALENEDISLEDSFAQYKEGMELLKFCHESIESVEQKVKQIAEDGSLEDFE